MFAFHQHFEKLYQIKWYFPDDQKEVMEKKLYVVFKKKMIIFCYKKYCMRI